jgi:DNA-binding winged helix-turn-helix (wHTH) protein
MQSPHQSEGVIRFGAFKVDLSLGKLEKHGVRIRLQEQPFQILAMLLEQPGRVVTREELQRRLWAADTFVDFDVGLNNAILRLRNALGDSADTPRFIETLPRRGYRFIATLSGPISGSGQDPIQTATTTHPQLIVLPPTDGAVIVMPPLKRLGMKTIAIVVLALSVLLTLLVGLTSVDYADEFLEGLGPTISVPWLCCPWITFPATRRKTTSPTA